MQKPTAQLNNMNIALAYNKTSPVSGKTPLSGQKLLESPKTGLNTKGLQQTKGSLPGLSKQLTSQTQQARLSRMKLSRQPTSSSRHIFLSRSLSKCLWVASV